MARCGCADPDLVVNGCACVLQAGPSGELSVTGTGSPDDPWVVDTAVQPGAGYIASTQVTVATSPTNFTIATYPTATWIKVMAVGGGGGGAGATATAGLGVARGGGAGGSYAESWIQASTLPASVTVTTGAGGAAGAAGNGTGGTGGTSSFGALVVAQGGFGSVGTTAPVAGGATTNGGSPPATAPTGQIAMRGERGDFGIQLTAGNSVGGSGGTSGNGWGSGGRGGHNNEAGGAGNVYGGGGGGAAVNGTAQPGGAGGDGLVVIEIYA